MSEFNNRIEVQREIIKIANTTNLNFEISGLSRNAIKRWSSDNNINSNSEIVNHLYKLSGKLFFLGNKSQEQITEDYKLISLEITEMVSEFKNMINK